MNSIVRHVLALLIVFSTVVVGGPIGCSGKTPEEVNPDLKIPDVPASPSKDAGSKKSMEKK